MNIAELTELVPALTGIARAAGETLLRYHRRNPEVTTKADNTPVTEADLASDRLIRAALIRLTPDVPVITEESFRADSPVPEGEFWLVDPLDGTREFIAGSGEFVVNIGLVGRDRQPLLGVMYAPVFHECYWAVSGQGAWLSRDDASPVPLHTRAPPAEGLTVVSSRWHGNRTRLDEFLAGYPVARRYGRGSTYKFCEVARGDADLYPHFGPTSEWDTIAGQVILVEAGGSVSAIDGGAFTYGKPGLRNGPFLAQAIGPGSRRFAQPSTQP